MQDYEKLGAFFLGRPYDLDAGQAADTPLLYDSKDLTTHAVCVGMTGSGKTGLCVGLLEEAAIDGIPTLAIDPKGDLGNLMLTFPDLKPTDFEPWVDEDAARKKGQTRAEFAADQAEMWSNGLASWGQDGERIRKLRDAAEVAIYTPGSTAGIPISVLDSFRAPPEALRSDRELLADRVSTTATSVLGLVGIDAEPLRSREHILLSSLLDAAWREGRDLDLAGLIAAVQRPPFDKVGVLDLESFYPEKDRFGLAMAINNLLAAPGFDVWMTGAPLDIDSLLWTPEGKPRIAILSIAHLSDSERMFFVSLLLNQLIGWMRSQPGTGSLRALLYMDEIFGYLPPVANPPSKIPLLTLLKQGRAFGVGAVLATQNPVDLDYKALSNAGTWFLGRLQTERDKMRVLEGLEGAGAGAGTFDKSEMEETLAGLGKRRFLMHNVHEDGPIVFETRWVMSYLAGPLTRTQIARLMEGNDGPVAAAASPPPATSSTAPSTPAAQHPPAAAPPASVSPAPPAPRGVEVFYAPAPPGDVHLAPSYLAVASIHFLDKKHDVQADEELVLSVPFEGGAAGLDWSATEILDFPAVDLEVNSPRAGSWGELPAEARKDKSYGAWKKELSDWLYHERRLELSYCPLLETLSTPGESERDFRIRLRLAAREERDAAIETLRDKYATRLHRASEKIRKAEQRTEKESEQARDNKLQTAVSLGATVLSAVFGRKLGSLGRATTAARGFGRSIKEAGDVQRAKETLESYREELSELEADLQDAVTELSDRYDPEALEIEPYPVRPRRTDVRVERVGLLWRPS